MAGTIGADKLSQSALALETALANQALGQIPKLMETFSAQTERIMTVLAPVCANQVEQAPPPDARANECKSVDRKQLRMLFEKLGELIDDGDSEAMELVGDIKAMVDSSEMSDDIRSNRSLPPLAKRLFALHGNAVVLGCSAESRSASCWKHGGK